MTTKQETGRQIIPLNGDQWRLAQASKETGLLSPADDSIQFFSATVPGDVRLDLMRAGRLPDPFFGQNSLASQWIDEHDWWLIRGLDDLDLPPDRRVFLRMRGIDYVSDTYFCGYHLERHEGMFSDQLHEVTGLFTASATTEGVLANTLAVRLTGPVNLPALQGERVSRLTRWRDKLEQRVALPNRWPHRRSTLKCQMGFGWDFAPDLPSMGIWDEVALILVEDVFIRDVTATPVFADDPTEGVQLLVTLDLDAAGHSEVEIGLNLYGLNCDAPPEIETLSTQLRQGRQSLQFRMEVRSPHLWWPWDRGEPNLYRLLVTVRRRAELLDSLSQTLGLRQIRLEPNPEAPSDALPWMFVINGRRTFLRGANWVPASIFPGQVTADDYKQLLKLARQANMNSLRVWGGGLREKTSFYELCDRLGLLVWQEFPFACAFITRHPRSDDFLQLVDREARSIVHRLRHHPSVILWCGGNEFDPTRDRPIVERLSRVVAAEDPTRPFVPVSPSRGDRHNWDIWHGFASIGAYRQERSQFASEFGLQAPPVAETLQQFLPEDELWPPGPSWDHHNADWPKLWRYASLYLNDRTFPEQVALTEFIAASQRAQARGLQVAIEHHRRRKYACGGCLLWQLNAPWPAIDWAIVDHLRRPKLAYQTVKRLYAPVLVSLEYPLVTYQEGSQFCPSVWVINDRLEPLAGCQLEITLESADNAVLERFESTLELAADSAEIVTRFCWTLPADAHWVRCHLHQGDEHLSFNEYDLSFHDSGRPRLWYRLRSWIGKRLMNGD